MTNRRERGTGRIYKRCKCQEPDGCKHVWYVRFSVDGNRRYESTGTDNRAKAMKALNKRTTQVHEGTYQGPAKDKLRFSDIEKMLEDHYYAKRSKDRASWAISKHLRPVFGFHLVKSITADELEGYVTERREAGAAEATIAYELAVLKKGLKKAMRANKLDSMPAFPEGFGSIENARTGFFEYEELQKLLAELPAHHKGWVRFAYITGWRDMSEILTRQWKHVDRKRAAVRLEPGETKNGKGRTFPYRNLPELKAVIEEQWEYTKKWQGILGREIPWVFHRQGKQIKDFYAAWRSACIRAGLCEPRTDEDGNVLADKKGRPRMRATKIPHDFRRTAVRNFIRAGNPEKKVMELTGHLTRSVFERYHIIDEQDLEEAVSKLSSLWAVEEAERAKDREAVNNLIGSLD